MPALGLGTFGSDHATPEMVADVVREALKMGYRYIDCAMCYGNEKEIGEVLQEAMDEGLKREELFILGKLWNDRHKPEDVIASCKKTLEDLKVGVSGRISGTLAIPPTITSPVARATRAIHCRGRTSMRNSWRHGARWSSWWRWGW